MWLRRRCRLVCLQEIKKNLQKQEKCQRDTEISY